MKRWIPLVVALTLSTGSLLTGCAHANTSQLSPSGNAEYAADQVVVRVNELENAAIAAAAANTITAAQARALVTFCVDADKTLATVPAGWQTALKQAWSLAKAGVTVPTASPLNGAMAAVDLVLGAL